MQFVLSNAIALPVKNSGRLVFFHLVTEGWYLALEDDRAFLVGSSARCIPCSLLIWFVFAYVNCQHEHQESFFPNGGLTSLLCFNFE